MQPLKKKKEGKKICSWLSLDTSAMLKEIYAKRDPFWQFFSSLAPLCCYRLLIGLLSPPRAVLWVAAHLFYFLEGQRCISPTPLSCSFCLTSLAVNLLHNSEWTVRTDTVLFLIFRECTLFYY